jgi:hypothetical protein
MQLPVLCYFAQHRLVPVLSPVVQFAQFWSVLESTMYFQNPSDLQTP